MGLKEIWKDIIGGAKQVKPKPMTTVFEPATPEPRYICQNCGMLIETGHKHTRDECKEYADNLLTSDYRARRVILLGRNDPKIRLPYYYDSLPE